jgi:hypothetical protein
MRVSPDSIPRHVNSETKDTTVKKTLIALFSTAILSMGAAQATTPAPAAAPAKPAAAKCDPAKDKNCKEEAKPAAAAPAAAPKKP